MSARYERKWGRTFLIIIPWMLAAIVICGVGYLMAWKKAVVVPENAIGLVSTRGLLWGHNYSTIPAGEHALDSFKRGTNIYAVPAGEQHFPFQVRVVPGLLGKAADNLGSSGIMGQIKGKLTKPVHVRGSLDLNISEATVLALVKQHGEELFTTNLPSLFEKPVNNAVKDHIDERADLSRYSQAASINIATSLKSFGVTEASVRILEAAETTVAAEAEGPLFESKLFSSTPLTIAETKNVFAFSAFIIGCVIAVIGILFLCLLITAPGLPMFEGLGLVAEIGGGVAEAVGSIGDIMT